MKFAAPLLAIAILTGAFAAPAYAQQSQAQSNEASDDSQSSGRGRRSFSGGRFTLDVAGHNVGFLESVEDEEQATTPTIENADALRVVPQIAAAPQGAFVLAPLNPDEDDENDN
jgi:hypothetical protein